MTATSTIREHIERMAINPEEISARAARQLAVQEGKSRYLPIIASAPLTDAEAEVYPEFRGVDKAYYSNELTLQNALRGIASMVKSNSDATPCVRADLGVGLAAVPFGAKNEVFEDKMPWVTEHVTLDDVENVDAEKCDLRELNEYAIERSRYLAEELKGTGVTPFCFDTQSPFALAHLIIGDDIFYAMYDEPERVHMLLDKATAMIIRLTQEYKAATGEAMDEGRHCGNFTMRGGVRVCEDTATLLNEEQVHEFVLPYTRRFLQSFGGGWVHYCGHNEHLYKAVMEELPEAYTLNLGNNEVHDMEQVIADCLAQGKTYMGQISRCDGEGTKDYFRRVQGYTQGSGRGLILLNDRSCTDDEVTLWRELQK